MTREEEKACNGEKVEGGNNNGRHGYVLTFLGGLEEGGHLGGTDTKNNPYKGGGHSAVRTESSFRPDKEGDERKRGQTSINLKQIKGG